MNGINLTLPGGFPLTQETLAFMQAAYGDTIGAIAGLFGDKVIISGCTNNGSNVSAGIVAVNGEILVTPGGSATTVFVQEDAENALFENGQNQPVYLTRTLRFGIGQGQMAWADFKRLNKILATQNLITTHIDDETNPHNVTKAQVGLGNIPNLVTSVIGPETDRLATPRAVWLLRQEMLNLNLPFYNGVFQIGDIGANNESYTIPIPNAGTNSYYVIGSLRGTTGTAGADPSMWVWYDPQLTSFKISVTQSGSWVQNLEFYYQLYRN